MSSSTYESTFELLSPRTKQRERDKGVILHIMEHQIPYCKKHSKKKKTGIKKYRKNTHAKETARAQFPNLYSTKVL